MKRITVETLRSIDACEDQVADFQKLFPKGAPVSMRSFNEAHKAGLDVFFLEKLLTGQARAEYEKMVGPERAEYEKIEGQAWAEYEKIEGEARAEHGIEGQAWAEYEKIEGEARAEYGKIEGQARAEYEKIQSLALVDALLKEGE